MKEEDAERAVGEALKQAGLRAYYTRSQLERGDVPNTEAGLKYLHSYSPLGGWYVLGVPVPYTVGFISGTDHASPYTYDTHVPAGFLRPSFPARNLPHSRRARGPGRNPGFAARHQCAYVILSDGC